MFFPLFRALVKITDFQALHGGSWLNSHQWETLNSWIKQIWPPWKEGEAHLSTGRILASVLVLIKQNYDRAEYLSLPSAEFYVKSDICIFTINTLRSLWTRCYNFTHFLQIRNLRPEGLLHVVKVTELVRPTPGFKKSFPERSQSLGSSFQLCHHR